MKAIVTQYKGATNYKGAKIVAKAHGVKALSIPYPHEVDGTEAHAMAAMAMANKYGWAGTYINGGLPNGDEVFVNTKGKHFEAGRMQNPRPRLGTAKPTRVSSATGKKPSKRLVSRRKRNKAKGYFPNPLNHLGEKTYQTYSAWRAACKKVNPAVVFQGDKDICEALPGVGHWDGDTGNLYGAAKNPAKRKKSASIYVQVEMGGVWRDVLQLVDTPSNRKAAAKDAKRSSAFYKTQARVILK
jgi:hypothetical protein